MANPKIGRRSIFRGKADGYRVQAVITKVGGKAFETHRKKLRMLVQSVTGRVPATVSDADVVESMARGEYETTEYLRRMAIEQGQK